MLPEEDIEVKVSSFYAKINQPVFSDLTLSFTNPAVRVTQVCPRPARSFQRGHPGRVRTLRLRRIGRQDKRPVQRKEARGTRGPRFPAERGGNEFIPRLWAARRVGWLLDRPAARKSTELKKK